MAESRETGSLLVTAVLSALFGSHAMDLGALVRFLTKGVPPEDDPYSAEYGLIVLAFGFLILVVTSGRQARRGGTAGDHDTFAAGIVVGLTGGFFSILDKTSRDGVPGLETAKGLLILCAIVFLFALPLLALVREGNRRTTMAMRLAIGCAIAGTGAAIAQMGFERIALESGVPLGGPFTPASTSFFLSALPVVALCAGWAMVAVDPLLNPARWREGIVRRRFGWLAAYILVALVLSAAYAAGPYALKHLDPETGWMARNGLGTEAAIALFWGLQIFPVLYAILAALHLRPVPGQPFLARRDLPVLAGVFLAGAACAALLAAAVFRTEPLTTAGTALFATGHGLAASFATLGLLVGVRQPWSEGGGGTGRS